MEIDSKITQAINQAVEEAGQPEYLASKLIAWFDAVVNGNEDINDDAATARRLEALFAGTEVNSQNREEYN